MKTDRGPIHILLAEDDEIDRELFERDLRQHEIFNPVTTANDGQHALELLRGENGNERLPRPYLIVLDWNMPRMNGLEFLKELRKDSELRSATVFVLTTSLAKADIDDAYQHLVAGYIGKRRVGHSLVGVAALLDAYCGVVELQVG